MATNKRNNFSEGQLDITVKFNKYGFSDKDEILNAYNKEVRSYKQLSREEEKDIINKIKCNVPDANLLKDQLIGSHQKFIISFAKRYCQFNSSLFLDLVQEGNIGMLAALDRYDSSVQSNFLCYANTWILKYMFQYLNNNTMIQRKNVAKYNKIIKKLRDDFINMNGYEPTSAELHSIANSRGAGIKYKEDIDVVTVVSFDSLIRNTSNNNDACDCEFEFDKADSVNLEAEMDKGIVKDVITEMLNLLDEDEQLVIMKRFGINDVCEHEFTSIASYLDIPPHQAKKLYKTGMRKLIKYIAKMKAKI